MPMLRLVYSYRLWEGVIIPDNVLPVPSFFAYFGRTCSSSGGQSLFRRSIGKCIPVHIVSVGDPP